MISDQGAETRKPRIRGASSALLKAAGALTFLALAAGCRQDMQHQPRMFPQRGSSMFESGRSVRPQVAHTVARGQLYESDYFYTGLMNGKEANMMPFPVTMQVLARGQERFNIYCTPCHSRVGNGAGMIVERGYKPAANFHDPRHLNQPLSHYFYVMTNGYGAMPDYKAQISPQDRWAIAAYIRALQLSQDANLKDVPSDAQVQNLKTIAQQHGYPESDTGPWPMPATAVWSTKPVGVFSGAPGLNPAPPPFNPSKQSTKGATGSAPGKP